MVEVRECSMLVFWALNETPALLAEYAEEAANAHLPPPNPSQPMYFQMERAGILHTAIAMVDGEMVGFLALLVNRNPHYSEVLAVAESFFVAQAHRKTGAGRMLKRWAEAKAEEQGALGLYFSARVGSTLAQMFERERAYRETNRIFFRSFTNE
jgi:GNAT superfamily N-acetyltransferase